MLDATLVNLTSSALARVAYDYHRQLLYVEFRDGVVYVYLDVPLTIYHDSSIRRLMAATSIAGSAMLLIISRKNP